MKSRRPGAGAVIISGAMTALLCAIAWTVPANAAGEAPSSVLDYYLALPDDYFHCELTPKITREYRMKQIVRKNIKNGYLLAKSDGFPMEVAIFVDAGGKNRTIAVNITCGEGCMCNRFSLLRHLGPGKWKIVTDDLMPSDEAIDAAVRKKHGEKIWSLVLPEFGTTVKVVESATNKPLLDLEWVNGAFRIK